MVQILYIERGNDELEDQRTLKLMLIHGFQNVRYGRYNYNIFYHKPKELIKLKNKYEHCKISIQMKE